MENHGPKPSSKCEHRKAYYSSERSDHTVSTWVCPDCTEVIMELDDTGGAGG